MKKYPFIYVLSALMLVFSLSVVADPNNGIVESKKYSVAQPGVQIRIKDEDGIGSYWVMDGPQRTDNLIRRGNGDCDDS